MIRNAKRHPEVAKPPKDLDSSPAFGGLRMTMSTIVLLLFATVATASSSLFSDANAKYLAGDFESAASLYQKTVDSGVTTAAVYYNLGNASLRLGQKGEAMLYYRRAQKAAPRDQDLLWNIRILKDALPDRIEERSSNPLVTPVSKAVSLFTPDEAALALSISLGLLTVALIAGLLFPSLKGAFAFPRSLAFFLMLVSSALLGLEWLEHKDPQAVVLDAQVTAYYGPSERETKAFTLHEGAEGRVIDESGDWIYLSLKNGTMGWVRKNTCEIV